MPYYNDNPPTQVTLLEVFKVNSSDLHPRFIEYDTIYLEHLEYLSLKPMVRFFEMNGLDLFDVQTFPAQAAASCHQIPCGQCKP